MIIEELDKLDKSSEEKELDKLARSLAFSFI